MFCSYLLEGLSHGTYFQFDFCGVRVNPKSSLPCKLITPGEVTYIARNLAVFSNVTLTKNLYGIRKSGHFTYSWYNNYYSRSCVFFIADMLQILAAVKTSRSPCVVKILQYIFFIFFSLLFCMAERGNAED